MHDTYAYTYPNRVIWEEGRALEDFGFSELATSRDVVGFNPPQLRNPQKYIALGINASLAVALHGLTNEDEICGRVDAGSLTARKLFGGMLGEMRGGRWPSTKYGLTIEGQPRDAHLEAIMLNETSPVDSQQYLADLLGDRAFLVSNVGSNAVLHFEVLIGGLLIITPEDSLVEVLRIEHRGAPEQPHPPISLAVRVGIDWHVFYYIDAVGRMNSPVWVLLDDLSDRVEVKEIKGIDTGYFLALCDRAFQYVSRQWKAQNDLNSDLRGAIPELLAAALLTRSGYFPVQPSLKEMKGVGQIDAIGFRETVGGGECRLVEVKRQSTNQNQLQTEIREFKDKVVRAKTRIGEIERTLGFTGSTKKVSGLFISMAEVGDLSEETSDWPDLLPGFFDTPDVRAEFKAFLDDLSDIEFWDYTTFRKELEAAGLPDIPIKLLKMANLVWDIRGPDANHEAELWSLLEGAVEENDWQDSNNSEAVRARVEDILRDQ